MPKVPYPYGKLVTGNCSLIPVYSLSNRSLLPSLTVLSKYLHILCDKNVEKINFYNEYHLTKSPSCYHDSQLESNFIKKQNNLHRISAQCPRGNKTVSLHMKIALGHSEKTTKI